GIQFTGGHIETSVDVLFCLGVYYGLRWWQVVPRRGLAIVLPALAVALGAALAAAQLLPFLEWLPLSAEYARRPPAAVTLFDPRCWRELLALPLVLFPNLYGNPTWPGPYRSYLPWGNYNENVLYVGTVPLLCALVALRCRRGSASPVWALAELVLVAAGMAFHLPALDWLNALPGLARANPARLRLVTSFGLALLAGFGADSVLDGGPPARRWFRGLAAAAVVELVGLGRGYTPAVPRRDFYPPTSVVSRLARDQPLHRVTALGETLVPDAHMMYGLADVRGLDFPTRWYAAYLDAAGRLPWI